VFEQSIEEAEQEGKRVSMSALSNIFTEAFGMTWKSFMSKKKKANAGSRASKVNDFKSRMIYSLPDFLDAHLEFILYTENDTVYVRFPSDDPFPLPDDMKDQKDYTSSSTAMPGRSKQTFQLPLALRSAQDELEETTDMFDTAAVSSTPTPIPTSTLTSTISTGGKKKKKIKKIKTTVSLEHFQQSVKSSKKPAQEAEYVNLNLDSQEVLISQYFMLTTNLPVSFLLSHSTMCLYIYL